MPDREAATGPADGADTFDDMSETTDKAAEDLLEFWFAGAGSDPDSIERRNRVWFRQDAAFDRQCSDRFGALLEAASEGELDHWKASPRGRLAFIVLLDQLSRNIHRGSATAYRQDHRALSACVEGIDLGHDRALSLIERTFFYLPMEHAEDRSIQDRSVEQFEALAKAACGGLGKLLESNVEYARQHRDIIDRFGRFPHRNAVLGRASTAEEEAYLAGDAPRFGQ